MSNTVANSYSGTSVLCPACKTQPLEGFQFHQIQVDLCVQCHGVWCDYSELQSLQQSDTYENIDQTFPGDYAVKPMKTKLHTDPLRLCPRDKVALERFEWNPGTQLVLDTCPECRGIWLDAGEVEVYSQYIETLGHLPPELAATLKAQMIENDARLKQRLSANWDEATQSVVRWDFGLLDDMLRKLTRMSADWVDGDNT